MFTTHVSLIDPTGDETRIMSRITNTTGLGSFKLAVTKFTRLRSVENCFPNRTHRLDTDLYLVLCSLVVFFIHELEVIQYVHVHTAYANGPGLGELSTHYLKEAIESAYPAINYMSYIQALRVDLTFTVRMSVWVIQASIFLPLHKANG